MTLELTMCMELLRRLKEFWDITMGEDRKMLAHSLFEEIVYDLDERRIVSFTLKSWAEPFLVLRTAQYIDGMDNEQYISMLEAPLGLLETTGLSCFFLQRPSKVPIST